MALGALRAWGQGRAAVSGFRPWLCGPEDHCWVMEPQILQDNPSQSFQMVQQGKDTHELRWWSSVIPRKRNSSPKLSCRMWEARALFSPSSGPLHNIWGQAVDMEVGQMGLRYGRPKSSWCISGRVLQTITCLCVRDNPLRKWSGENGHWETRVHGLRGQVMHHQHQLDEHRAVSSLGLSAVKAPGRRRCFLH